MPITVQEIIESDATVIVRCYGCGMDTKVRGSKLLLASFPKDADFRQIQSRLQCQNPRCKEVKAPAEVIIAIEDEDLKRRIEELRRNHPDWKIPNSLL